MTPLTPYLALFLGLIALLAYCVARMTARPIQDLAAAAAAAAAAGALGSDLDRAPLIEAGPTEIRQAAAAFNAMQSRICRQVQHRTHMLAAITHNLQIPLTRLRLRLEKVNEPDLRDKLIGDLGQMQSMVREGLELARSMDSQEPLQRLDINSLVDSVCTDAGPGLPPDQMEAVFDPFFRLETSRSRDTGGTGLGLTIARNIAENHAGTLVLRNHPDGGLEAWLTLPLIYFVSEARTF